MQQPAKHTNRLIDETSPYLLQHAHNPVDWYPWGDEAFERARKEDKPVLVSIGYSACHWCHVMAHESFEDEATAAVMNEHFINIKVDMEERPDIDQIYMTFVQMTTGRGGWPMTVFVTPEKMPFFGGTYFPPTPRYGMPSFTQLLLSIADAWRNKRDEIMHSAIDMVGELRRASLAGDSGTISPELSDQAFTMLERSFDTVNGGFGGAPKFPPSMTLEFLLRYHWRTGNERALAIVSKTAEEMAKGGIYDQLGGGFHRYSVDAVWLVPHFEKMLYDNAQLVRIYLHLYQIFRSKADEESRAEYFRRIAVETLEYVRREMLDPSGGFYSSQDADSEGEEGKFFVWSPDEIAAVLGDEDARLFCSTFDVTAAGNFEGKNILNLTGATIEDIVKVHSPRLEHCREKLFEHRENRIKPFRDEKVLTAWNGLMLAAFAEAAAVLDEPEYLDIAKNNAEFLLNSVSTRTENGQIRVLRTWKDGRAKLNGYVEDYANFADGLIELYQVSGEEKYLSAARELADVMIAEFWDGDGGGFFFTSNDHEELIVRNKDMVDNAAPSGNSAAADVLLRLSKFYGEEMYRGYATGIMRSAAGQIRRFPSGFGRMLGAAEFLMADVKEIAIVGADDSEMERVVWTDYIPFKVVATGGQYVPLMKDRQVIEGRPTAYVCEDFVCQRPVTDPIELGALIAGRR